MSDGSSTRYFFDVPDVTAAFLVLSFSAREGISTPFEVNLSVVCETTVTGDMVLGREGLLTIVNEPAEERSPNGPPTVVDTNRYFHGVINRFTFMGTIGNERNQYTIRLVPDLWFLSLEKDCRIFHNKSIREIVATILTEAMIDASRFDFRDRGEQTKLEYCTQFNETDLHFISRLLAHEGIFYFFEHLPDKHLLVFGNDPSNYLYLKGNREIPFNPAGGLNAGEEAITSLTFSQRSQTDSVAHTDFDYTNPPVNLEATKNQGQEVKRQVYVYPGAYDDQKRGARLAKIRHEELSALNDKAVAMGSCARLVAGATFHLTRFDKQSLNKEYLIVTLEHSGSQPQAAEEFGGDGGGFVYLNGFTAIDAKLAIRPRHIPKPAAPGTQSAIVVGAKGEEIETDEFGRVKVQFHWDREGQRDANSSCFIRVAQSWAGGGWGALFIPRIGDEVLVDFIDGDLDRPIIVGCVYNAENIPIHNAKENKTRSGFRTKSYKGKGFNELRFDDKAGAEEIYIHGQKDLSIEVKNNETKTVGTAIVNHAGKTATISAGEQLKLVCGASSIVLDKSGTIVIHGKEVFATGTGSLHLDGKPIKMNMGGMAGASATAPAMKAAPAAKAAGAKALAAKPARPVRKLSPAEQGKKERRAARFQLIADARKKAATMKEPDKSTVLKAADDFKQNIDGAEKAVLSADAYHYVNDVGAVPVGYLRGSESPLRLPKGITKEMLAPRGSGFRAEIYYPDKEILGPDAKPVLVFKGTTSREDWKNNFQQGLGKESDYYKKAMNLASLMNQATNGNFEIAGHSLGGGMASAAGVITGAPTTTFNPAGLHNNTVAAYGKSRADGKHIMDYIVKGEVLNAGQDGITTVGSKMVEKGISLGGITGPAIAMAGAKVLADSPPTHVGKEIPLPGKVGASGKEVLFRDPISRHSMGSTIPAIEAVKEQNRRTLARAVGKD
ncbi:type VI secretion system tip protein TssI/VgrG [Geobacter sp.]|uniref:type VI secretion system tip protein TssI/VgrG n=1 Tax=Geobacter sp. TaxID=46610 RepID=UPI0027B9EE1C|nr:type VI secretion system tip protein TssI/VgrG [Geobacter sp.]